MAEGPGRTKGDVGIDTYHGVLTEASASFFNVGKIVPESG